MLLVGIFIIIFDILLMFALIFQHKNLIKIYDRSEDDFWNNLNISPRFIFLKEALITFQNYRKRKLIQFKVNIFINTFEFLWFVASILIQFSIKDLYLYDHLSIFIILCVLLGIRLARNYFS